MLLVCLHLTDWRRCQAQHNDERNAMYSRSQMQRWAAQRRDMNQKIAAQRRKWQVKFYTESGKPDPKRPSGRLWKAADFPHRESMTLNAGQVHLEHQWDTNRENTVALQPFNIDRPPGTAAASAGPQSRALSVEQRLQQAVEAARRAHSASQLARNKANGTVGTQGM